MNNGIPKHVGIILDGNGRWAIKRGYPRKYGHKEGVKTLKKIATYSLDLGVETLSVFAFSSENFQRDEEEVKFLMDLFVKTFNKEKKFFDEKGIKIIFSGRKEPLNDKVYEKMLELSEGTKNNTKGTLNICLNYGGKNEIIDASFKMAEDISKGKLKKEDLTEEIFSQYFYHNLPPIDLLIRTSGEKRISNFMLYQIAYSEIYFTKVLFPDFSEKEFDKALSSYGKRNRRFGRIK